MKVKVKITQLCPALWGTPWTIQSWNNPGQNTGVGSRFRSPGDLPNPGIKPRSPALQADSFPLSYQGSPLCTIGTIKK